MLQRELAEIIPARRAQFPARWAYHGISGTHKSGSRTGKVYLSLFPVKDKQGVIDTIKTQSHRIRGQLESVSAAHADRADLNFYIDDSLDRADEIDRLLKK